MKVQKIVGMMACAAFASAFADPINNNIATTNDWFTGAASGATLTITELGSAAWKTNTTAITESVEGVEVSAGRIILSNDSDNPLKLVPADQSALNDGLVTITSVATLTPNDVGDLYSAEIDGAKVGLAVAIDDNVTNYYGYANGAWTKLTNANPPDSGDTTFKIVIDYRVPCAQFYVTQNATDVLLASNDTSVTVFALASGTTQLSSIDCFGSGELASINAKYEKAVATAGDGKKYGTIAQAYNHTTSEQSVAVLDADGSVSESQTAANGLSKSVCMALNMAIDDPNVKIALQPAAIQNAGKITLATAVDPVDGVTVSFTVETISGTNAGSESYPADGIQIPQGTGTYRVVPTVQ